MKRFLPLALGLALLAAACSGSGSTTTTTLTSGGAVSTQAAETPTATSAPTTVPPTSAAPTTTTTTTSTTTTTTTIPAGPSSPLNGIEAADPALLERRVIAIKIDNHPRARPQSGLQEADAIVELRVEGGLTRFIALFHDNASEYVGPVRSGRPTDAGIVKPLRASFQFSGAQQYVRDYLSAQGVRWFGEGSGTFRISARSAPHNLYATTAGVRDVADRRDHPDEPPVGLYELGPLGPGDEPATLITMDWSQGNAVTWTWDGERYLRSLESGPHEWRGQDGTQEQVAVDVLVVISGRLFIFDDPTGQGSSVPTTETVGTGEALVFAGGEVVRGIWSRDNNGSPFQLTRPDGTALLVPPGTPWISVFPDDRTIAWQ